MTIFDLIKDILYKKSGDLLAKEEFQSEFQPFILQRWLSMHSNLNVRILNVTTNKVYKAIADKEQWYKLFITTLPKAKFKKFSYIKKSSSTRKSEPKTNMEQAIKLVAQKHKISEREVKDYIENYGLDITKIASSLTEK